MASAALAGDPADATGGRGFTAGAALREGSHEGNAPRPHLGPAVPGLVSLTRARIETVRPGDVRDKVVQEDSRSVVLESDPGGERFALAKGGRRLEGQVASIDGSSVTLLVRGRVFRVRRQDIVRLEVPRRSTAGAFLGGLLGAYAGAWVAANVPALRKGGGGDGIGIGRLVLILGAGLGGARLGYSGWETFPLPGDGRVSLALKPTRRGAAVGMSLSF